MIFVCWSCIITCNLVMHKSCCRRFFFFKYLIAIQCWVFFGRNDVKAETPVLWPPHAKSWLIGKDSDAGRDWGQEEKGTTDDEMAGWHHRLDGHESEWTPGVGDGQGGLACCDSWGRKESDRTEWLNWTELNCYSRNPQLCPLGLKNFISDFMKPEPPCTCPARTQGHRPGRGEARSTKSRMWAAFPTFRVRLGQTLH